jgi:hypothetical protein
MSESLYKISSEYQSKLNELDENTDMEAFTEWLNQAAPDLRKEHFESQLNEDIPQ